MKKWTSLLLALAMALSLAACGNSNQDPPRSLRHLSAAPLGKKRLPPQARKRPQRSHRRNLPRVKHPPQGIPVPC